MTDLRPLQDFVAVERVESEPQVNATGLLVSISRSGIAMVVAVGPGYYSAGSLVPTTVKVGDKVLMGDGGQEIYHMDKKYLILRERDILAVL